MGASICEGGRTSPPGCQLLLKLISEVEDFTAQLNGGFHSTSQKEDFTAQLKGGFHSRSQMEDFTAQYSEGVHSPIRLRISQPKLTE